jgi:transcriptional antiterminator RfaH
MPFWSVVQTESQREHTAARFLEQAAFEIYLPRTVSRQRSSERVVPLFPGYLFIRIIDQWWSVRWTTGVLRLLMHDNHPAQISAPVLNLIRRREDRDGLVRLPRQRSRGLVCGDAVKILRGSFEGRFGVYQGQSGGQRSRILLDLLGREVQTVIATADMTRVGRPLAPRGESE